MLSHRCASILINRMMASILGVKNEVELHLCQIFDDKTAEKLFINSTVAYSLNVQQMASGTNI